MGETRGGTGPGERVRHLGRWGVNRAERKAFAYVAMGYAVLVALLNFKIPSLAAFQAVGLVLFVATVFSQARKEV